MTANAPGPCALGDDYRELLTRSISVSERAAEAAVSGNGGDRMFLAQQISGLTVTLEQIRDRLALSAAAYEQGWRDAQVTSRPGRLRVVAR